MMFNKDLIDLILAGKKTATSRDKRQFREGDITNLMANKDYSRISGKCIQFTAVYSQILKNYTEEDAHKEGFRTLSDFKQYWIKNIDEWKDDREQYVHEFKLIDYDPKFFQKDRKCEQCGSCCMQLKDIINIEKEDITKWVKDCRADILQYCYGWHEDFSDYMIFAEDDDDEKEIISHFMDGINMEMWCDPKTGDGVYLCPFLTVDTKAKKFECQIQEMKPLICKDYLCRPSKMLSIVKKPFEENLKVYRKERRFYKSVKSAPNKLEKSNSKA